MSTTAAEAAYRRMSEADFVEYYGETSQDEIDAYEEQRELDAAGPRDEVAPLGRSTYVPDAAGGFGGSLDDCDDIPF